MTTIGGSRHRPSPWVLNTWLGSALPDPIPPSC